MPEEERRKMPQNNLGVKKKNSFELSKERLRGLYKGDKYMWLIFRISCYRGGNIRRIHVSEEL